MATTMGTVTPKGVSVNAPNSVSLSLLSRISPKSGSKKVAALEISSSSRVLKRRASDDEETRPSKRRAYSNDAEEKAHPSQQAAFAPWLDGSVIHDADASREDRMHDELIQFVAYISASEKEREARRMLVERIEALLRTRWQDVKVTLFGSSATGLELTGGDIDLVIAFNPSFKLADPERKRRLTIIGDILRRSGVTTWVNRIFGARVPIITFTTIEALGELSVDISIRNDEDSGPRAIPIVKQFLEDMPALRPLVHAIKAFLSLQDLNDASQGTLSSYAITIMCISFLQRNPARRAQALFDEPVENKALGILLMDFFRHYGHDFSYATHYISVTEKGIFTKKLKNWEHKGSAVLAVQCMLNPDNNITRGCSKICLIVDAFKQAYHTLQTTSYSTSENAPISLLNQIYTVPEEVDAKRNELEKSVDSGAFARAVTSCSTESNGTRSVSGGVALTTRVGSHNRESPMRLGPGPAVPWNATGAVHGGQAWSGGIQPLPVLHYRDNQLQAAPQFQFQFQSQPQIFPGMNFLPQMQAGPTFFGYQNNVRQHFGHGYGHYNNNHYQQSAQRRNGGQGAPGRRH
ncbi:hypothetical protein M0805_003291 [Coniferiporia weirii]|nr:hypothetical protein M0805_003291 [Coniferiporia weirii]